MTQGFDETARVGSIAIRIESGSVARQAGGAVLLESGDSVLLATATAPAGAQGPDFLPLTVDYRLRFSSAGRIPGSYDRREARPTDQETLTSRLIDRSVRPLFPKGYRRETQVIVQPLSSDPESDLSVLAITAAAAALAVSGLPWAGPVAAARIGRVDGKLVVFPAPSELQASDLDLVVSVSADGLVMVEGGASELPESVLLEAFALARRELAPLLETLDRLRQAGRPRQPFQAPAGDEAGVAAVGELAEEAILAALAHETRHERQAALDAALADCLGRLGVEAHAGEPVRAAFAELTRRLLRREALEGRRIAGRTPEAIRAISGRTGWLKRCHGSSLFTRGETQAIVTCTLGSAQDARSSETLQGRQVERFMLHYNFPAYSVGEVRSLRGPGRREIGHGHLARRALVPVLAPDDESAFTIRLESLITESNGSSSMATVCGASLALENAGVRLLRPVAGIAMGLVKQGDRHVVLSDITGEEDQAGDMDFKVCGSERGVTAIQLDNKLGSLEEAILARALEQARAGRLHILARMRELKAAGSGPGPHAPRALTLSVEPSRIGGLMGTGGRTIKALQSELDVTIDVGDGGRVRVYAREQESLNLAEQRVRDLTGVPRLGEVYAARVVTVQPYGSFVRLFEGVEGLLADTQLELEASVSVRVTGVTNRGKLVLERAG